ncbi:Nif3-like dinuclear metal center hexameric protein [Rathayibacter toxicus]|uniref:Nif3-like dinuclear metal center hexameric protein n=1 Tax=Rathayibacter toxicus TaxID=145458 RepID=UPI000CE88EA9|nr:Nif3-like dinuclear metal center hexameric protein [Rathayibacter toxicus]PPI55258.1 Nif3-like dinuclear metal center hexameric protein [Rathayibacter toxicus]QOD09489.1 Nif3-like dinuclear metal center hexameric protein [Rathayibacter toxicus]QWL28157.1 Nif3-like dinuclear metal center hexameric protein [Rathayibacter toxicus]QWL32354.1 Nif3-like dinuclear metal center hexameric protein [Rathayibacter toxicus]QWL34448.1 Nif3-like dinuclear metal center hexameric protein [Rathayibacter toxi
MPTLREVHAVVDRLWPEAGAEGWDAPGVVTGNPDAPVERILLTVDVVADTVTEAVTRGYQLLLAHHPLLLRGVTSIAEDGYKGHLLAKLIRGGCALVSAHTNADIVADGISDVIAARLGLTETIPLVPRTDQSIGLGRVGELPEQVTLGRLARVVSELLPPTAGGVRASGGYDVPVRRVALCGGAGDSLLDLPAVRTSDVYITADLRHHPASEAREKARHGTGPALLDVSHWASEWLWLDVAAAALRMALPTVTVEVSEIRTDPWDFAIVC